ncbi:MAG TPA: energy-coupling factor transporter transmembrane component T [Candidatus Limnocylindria bacterium]|nr:energy-coupling factor transporter transmembrane component T [Candidatus Limnocylindria bacterium]
MAGGDRLTEAARPVRGIPPSLGRPGPTAYHRLNPLTKATLATVTAIGAVLLGGVVGPVGLVIVAVLVPAAVARVLPQLVRTGLLLSAPIAISAFVVNLFFYPGAETVLLQVGPIAATAEGLAFAVEILVRILAISGAVTLFYLTTRPADLVVDLERRGVSPRVGFVANASVQTVPAMVDRAQQITAAQRARGLDTEGSVWRRIRGVVPIVGPVILGSIAEVEERTMALEARGFTRPGRRTLLWTPADSTIQAIARWALVLALVGVIVGRIAGVLG